MKQIAELLEIKDIEKMKRQNTNVITLEAKDVTVVDPAQPKRLVNEEHAANDYTIVRNSYQNLITKSLEALDRLIDVAAEDEKAFTYQTVATMVKNISEVVEKLDAMHLKRLLIEKQGSKHIQEGDEVNIDKAVFVGNSSDLLDKLREVKK